MHDEIMSLRERILPLPTPADGYTRVLLLGTTGAGKTTLVRQLIGTDPSKEHFPSISTAKTTTNDIEIILAESPFQAFVSFLPRQQIVFDIEECVTAAVLAYLEQKKPLQVAQKLYEHSEQRFRLNYLLGKLPRSEQELFLQVDEKTDAISNTSRQRQTALPDVQHMVSLRAFLEQITTLAAMVLHDVEAQPDFPGETLKKEERSVFIEKFLLHQLSSYHEFQQLVGDIMHAIEGRFGLLESGQLTYGQDGWPLFWTGTSSRRADFLQDINRFTSNTAALFGRLLTPLVQGIRVKGPFQPLWSNGTFPRFVLIDGEGLGHVAEIDDSLSTKTTERFDLIDAIVLVDNAQQPMQAAPGSVLSNVVTSGYVAKLFVCFTHFDLVDGANFEDEQDKRDHVRRSLENSVAMIGKKRGLYNGAALRQRLEHHVFFLSHLAQKDLPEATRDQLHVLVQELASIHPPTIPVAIQPIYEERRLLALLPQAVSSFREAWQGCLGLNPQASRHPEHWNTIKAFSRRPAELGLDEYKNLRPVADLIRITMEQVKCFLDAPLTWEHAAYSSENERQVVIDAMAQVVYTQLHPLARTRIIVEHLSDWRIAFCRSGTGSTNVRARDIESIYATAAPVSQEVEDALNSFLRQVTLLIQTTILAEGGKLL